MSSSRAAWNRSDDADILRQLGVIDSPRRQRGGGGAFEEVDIEEDGALAMVTASEGDSDEPDNDDVVFDRDALLDLPSIGKNVHRNRAMVTSQQRKLTAVRAALVCVTFFAIGLFVSITGPTLLDVQSNTNASSFTTVVVSVVGANSFGGLLGVTFGAICFACLSPFCVMALLMFVCAFVSVFIPWCATLTGLTIVCFLQGISLGALERGGYAMFYAYWRKRYQMLQLFYVALAFGGVLSPLVTTPFVFNHRFNAYNSSALVDPSHTRVGRDVHAANLSNSTLMNASTSESPVDGPPAASTERLPSKQLFSPNKLTERPVRSTTASSTSGSTAAATTSTTTTSVPSTTSVTTSTSTTSTSTTTTQRTTVVPTKRTASTLAQPAATEATKPAQSAAPKSVTSPQRTTAREWSSDDMREYILARVTAVNRVQFAFLAVSALAMALVLCFALACCCSPCQSLAKAPVSEQDFRLNPAEICRRASSRRAVALALALAALLAGIEATVAHLLTTHVVWAHGSSQARAVVLTSIFWSAVAASRLCVALATRKRSADSLSSALGFGLGGATASAAVVGVLGRLGSPLLLWLAVATFGLSVGPLLPVCFCWLDRQLAWSPWFSTLWLLAADVGRCALTLVGASVMEQQSQRALFLVVLVACVLCDVIFVLARNAVKRAQQTIEVEQITRHMNGEFGVPYRRIETERPDDDGLDDFLFEGDDLVHFDRNGQDGAFARYTAQKGRTLE